MAPKADRTSYDALVDQSKQGSIYCRRWWLDAVAPAAYRILESRKDGLLQAAWPVVMTGVHGSEAYDMPPLTQKLGILFAHSEQTNYSERLSRQHELTEELIHQLSPKAHFVHRFHENFANWLPFYWHGYQQTTRYTYIVDDINDEESLWQRMRSSCRRNIRKAQKEGLRITQGVSLDEFIRLRDAVFLRQGIQEPPGIHAVIRRLDEACATRNCRRIFAARDGSGKVHAAAYVVWDNGMAYYLMGGSDPELRQSGGLRLAQWQAMRYCAKVATRFDFEGSMIRNVEAAFRSFGARQVPYFSITKSGSAHERPRVHPRRIAGGVLRRLARWVDPI